MPVASDCGWRIICPVFAARALPGSGLPSTQGARRTGQRSTRVLAGAGNRTSQTCIGMADCRLPFWRPPSLSLAQELRHVRLGSARSDVYAYPATSNRLLTVTRGASTVRALSYDGNGNIVGDNRLGAATTYGTNARNRLTSATSGALVWAYGYNAREQLVSRSLVTGGPDLTHFVHDLFGNVIAETNGSGPAGTTREYIWLPETEIAPTSGSRAQIDRPLGVVSGVGGVSPQLWPASVSSQTHQTARRPPQPPVAHDGCGEIRCVDRDVAALGRRARHYRLRRARRAPARPVVPTRSGLALQLAPPLRSQPRPLHAARSVGVRGWAGGLWVCEGESAEVCGPGWAILIWSPPWHGTRSSGSRRLFQRNGRLDRSARGKCRFRAWHAITRERLPACNVPSWTE
jgi:YD repeat-containing protein